MTIVKRQQRTVFVAPTAGRAYLTKPAAYVAEARARLLDHCECCEGSSDEYGPHLGTETVCSWHDKEGEAHRDRVVARWARLLAAQDRVEPKGGE